MGTFTAWASERRARLKGRLGQEQDPSLPAEALADTGTSPSAETQLPSAEELAPDSRAADLVGLDPWGRHVRVAGVVHCVGRGDEVARACHLAAAVPSIDATAQGVVEAHLVPAANSSLPAVMIGPHWVGNLASPHADEYVGIVTDLAARGEKLVVRAELLVLNEADRLSAQMTLMLPELNEIQPPSSIPAGRALLLPRGNRLQVTSEAHHLDLVTRLLEGREEQPVAATLQLAPASRAKPRLEVSVGGEVVGQLPPYLSEPFLAVLHQCNDAGVALVCHASVLGSQSKDDVVLDTMLGDELRPEWVRAQLHGQAGPSLVPAETAARREGWQPPGVR